MTAPDLLPCPFCGGKAVAFSYITKGAVRCGGCRAAITRGHIHTSETGYEEAIAAWNTRATPAPDPAAIREAALRKALKAIGDLSAEFSAGGSPTAAKVLELANDRILALISKGADHE